MAASMPVRLSTATNLRPALRLAKGRSSASSALRPVLGRTCTSSTMLNIGLVDHCEESPDNLYLEAVLVRLQRQ